MDRDTAAAPMVWRVGWIGQLGGTLTAIACVWVAAIVVQQEWQFRPWYSALWFPALLTVIALAGAAMFTWLPRIRLTPDVVEVRNPFRRYRVPLTDLVGARTSTNGVQLTTADGRTVSSWALQKPPIAQRTRRHTRADDAVREIRRAAERAWRAAGRKPPETLRDDERDPRKRHPRQRARGDAPGGSAGPGLDGGGGPRGGRPDGTEPGSGSGGSGSSDGRPDGPAPGPGAG